MLLKSMEESQQARALGYVVRMVLERFQHEDSV